MYAFEVKGKTSQYQRALRYIQNKLNEECCDEGAEAEEDWERKFAPPFWTWYDMPPPAAIIVEA